MMSKNAFNNTENGLSLNKQIFDKDNMEDLTFEDNQLKVNYVFKLLKHTYEFTENGAPELTPKQKHRIMCFFNKDDQEEMKCGGSFRTFCEGYWISHMRLNSTMRLFSISKKVKLEAEEEENPA